MMHQAAEWMAIGFACLIVPFTFALVLHYGVRATEPELPCREEILQGAGRCSHAKHKLHRVSADGSLWACVCHDAI
jgi:hypothetical protein